MGGNPGSSMRCEQCRRRKKKCDLQRPACRRCIDSGLECSGPVEKRTFINRDVDNHLEPDKAILTAAFKARSVKLQLVSNATRASIDLDAPILRTSTLSIPNPINLSVMDDLLSTSSTRMLYDSMMAEFSPQREMGIFAGDRNPAPNPSQSMIAVSIRMLIPSSTVGSKVLDLGIFALLAKYLGSFKHYQELIDLADSSYTAALGEFHRRLGGVTGLIQNGRADPTLYQKTLHLCLALLWFESINWSPVASKADVHVNGALTILQNAQPEQSQLSRLRAELYGLRGMVISLSLRNRRATFLADARWRMVQCPSSQITWVENLHDTVIHLPSLLERFDAMKNSPFEQHLLNGLETLQDEYLSLKQSLELWLQNLIDSEEQMLYWTSDEASTIATPLVHLDPVCIPSFPDQTYRLRFKDGGKASLLAHNWAYRLQVLLGLIEVQDQKLLISGRPQDCMEVEKADLELWWAEAYQLARMVVEAVNYTTCCLEGCIVAQGPWEIVMRYHDRLQDKTQVTEMALNNAVARSHCD